MGLDLAHGVAVIDALAAVGALVEFEIGDHVWLAVIAVPPISPDPLDAAAAASGTSPNLDEWLSHALEGPLRGDQKIVCLDTGLGIKFPFRVDGQTGQIRALDDV